MDSGLHSLLAQDYGFHRQNFPVFLYMGGVITLGNVSCNFLANLQQIERRSGYVTLPWWQNFWMTTNRHFKVYSHYFNFTDLVQFHLIWQMLA